VWLYIVHCTFEVCAVVKLMLHSSCTWWAIMAQYRLQEESRPLLTTAMQTDSHIFLLRHSTFLVYIGKLVIVIIQKFRIVRLVLDRTE